VTRQVLSFFSSLISQLCLKKESRANRSSVCPFLFGIIILTTIGGCAVVSTRPTQEMADTQSAIRAAKEVQADSLAPDLYRQSNEWFFKAKREYKLKNFSFAEDYAEKAREFAEQAEFEAIKNGGNRTGVTAPPLEL